MGIDFGTVTAFHFPFGIVQLTALNGKGIRRINIPLSVIELMLLGI